MNPYRFDYGRDSFKTKAPKLLFTSYFFLMVCTMLAAKGSSFTTPDKTEGLSSSSNSRNLQQTCAGGFVLNTCANCTGCKFTSVTTLSTAVTAYRQNKTAAISTYGEMKCWDVSDVTSMHALFYYSPLNEPIGCWNVSKVAYMSWMFYGANNFNQDISSWDVSSVTSMYYMFYGATSFDQVIGNWNVSKVNDMHFMFYNTGFNQDIRNWDVGRVTDMQYMFYGSANFDQDISNWNVARVTNMNRMFYSAIKFDQDLCVWYNVLLNTHVFQMFSNSGCTNPQDPDFSLKTSFCQACTCNGGKSYSKFR